MTTLWEEFERLGGAATSPLKSGQFRVAYVGEHLMLGIDGGGLVCALVEAPRPANTPAVFDLSGVQAYYAPNVEISIGSQERRTGCVVVRCRNSEPEVQRYFLGVWGVISDSLSSRPTVEEVMNGVDRLVSLFARVSAPSEETITGFVGELVFLSSLVPLPEGVRAWHRNPQDRFDFVYEALRIEVKTTIHSQRRHVFSYDQANATHNAYVASILLEETDSGTTVSDLLDDIVARCSAYPELQMKVWDMVGGTLGQCAGPVMRRAVALESSIGSLRFFKMEDIPAIRGALPQGLTAVHFRSDLGAAHQIAAPVELRR